MILVIFLICFFLFLILNQLFIGYNYNYKEGFDETTTPVTSSSTDTILPYDSTTTDATLPQQNAKNIMILEDRLTKLEKLSPTVTELSNNYTSLNEQVQGLVKQQTDYANQLNGGSDQPITVTGL